MSKDPAVLFYTSDFLSGTSFFTDEERGQYIRLLCEQHQLDLIPENHMILICKSLDSVVVKKFIRTDDGFYYNDRMRIEKERRINYCKSRGLNKKGHTKNKIISKSYENHMTLHMENENENENKNVIGLKKIYGKFVKLSKKEYEQLVCEYSDGIVKDKIVDLDDYIGSQGKKYKSHYHTLRNWIRKDMKDGKHGQISGRNTGEKYEEYGKLGKTTHVL